jgi:hypothetical protein
MLIFVLYLLYKRIHINVLVLLMTLSPDDRDRELYYLKPRRNNVLLNENKFKPVFKYQ